MTDIDKIQWIRESLRASYEAIAPDFDRTRQVVTPELASVASIIQPGQRVLDLGCGNGRLLKAAPAVNFDYCGVDSNVGLIEQARKAFPERQFVLEDMTQFDFGQQSWDQIFCIASFHHLVTRDERVQFLRRAHEALRPGGALIMTNWRLWQWRYLKAFLTQWRYKINWNDTFVTWNHQYPRFYHAFTRNELHSLLREAGFHFIETSDIRHNYVTIARSS